MKTMSTPSSQILKWGVWTALALALGSCGNPTTPPGTVPSSVQPLPLQKTELTSYVSQTPTRWFVELTVPSSASGNFSAQSVLSAQSSFRALAKSEGLDYAERYSYSRLFSGISLEASDGTIARISQLPGVRAIYPVGEAAPPAKTEQTTPALPTGPLDQTGASVAQSELGLTGKGVRVGVIDTGLDVNHPAFKNRIVAQYDFVGKDYNKDGVQIALPRESAADNCEGHGTHVAGIVGAKDERVKGVAPDVSFGIYKVFGCTGGAPIDAIVAALERAASDKMQVVNLSLGGFGGFPGPFAEAMDRLADMGIVVVKSAGNSADKGTFSTDGDNDSDKIISVSSFDNAVIARGKLMTKPANKELLFASSNVNEYLIPGLSGIVTTGTPDSGADGCAALPANSLKGQMVLIRRGGCTFQVKSDNAEAAGAKAVIIYNRPDGGAIFGPSTTSKLPIAMISFDDGVELYNELQVGPVQVDVSKNVVNIANPTAGLLSDFSSYGPTSGLKFKPDLGAPGGEILSTFPLELGGYAVESGTSMSSPHVAGLVALMLQANPNLKPAEIRTRLMNNAVPQLFAKAPELGLLDAVQRQGAGMANVIRSLSSKVTVTPSSLSLGDNTSSQTQQTLTIQNSGTSPVTYTLDHKDSINTQSTFKPNLDFGDTKVDFVPSTVTVPAGGSATVQVKVTASDDQFAKNTIYGGYVVLSSSSSVLRVPFVGFKGNYNNVKALTLGKFFVEADGKLYSVGRNEVFNPLAGELPVLGFQLGYPVKRVELDVLDGNTYLPIFDKGHWVSIDGLGRNQNPGPVAGGSVSDFLYTVSWDGSLKGQQQLNGVPVSKNMPNGFYALRVRVLKMTGDANNSADWENFSSVPFFIIRKAE